MKVDIETSKHIFEKTNIVSLKDKKGVYDALRCKQCGIKGKSYSLNTVVISKVYSEDKAYRCPQVPIPNFVGQKVEIIKIWAYQAAYDTLTEGTISTIIESPDPDVPNTENAVWVMGNGIPVRIMKNEFKLLI